MSPPRQVSPARDESGGRDARFEALLESAPDSIVGVGSDGRILFVNREGERSFGYRREELVGQPVEVLLPERFRAAHGFHRGSYLALPRTRPMGAGLDLVARRRDGSEFPVEISLSPLETADGLIVTAIVRDVTARRAADRRLRDRERQLQTAQQVAQLGSWEYRLGAERVEWSDQLFRIYGLEPGDPRGGTPESLRFVHPDDREAVRQAVETAIADRSPLELEYRIVRTDGAERILSSRGEVIVDPDDGSVRVVGTALDVTERKETERHLRESQRALSTLMSNLPGMAYRCRNDRDWTIEFVSDGCLDVTGYRPDDLVGNRKLSYGEVIHPDDRETVWNDVQAALAAGRLFQLTYRIRHATGAERWVWEQGQGVFGSDGTLQAIEGFLTDITSRQRAFEELARARDEA
ncbi:MAG: PAS domain-containing protein, partial [Candidatus Binatia bacterium]